MARTGGNLEEAIGKRRSSGEHQNGERQESKSKSELS